MTPQRLRELEWAATFLKTNKPRRGCRCARTCPTCRKFKEARSKTGPGAIIELIDVVKELQSGNSTTD